MKNLIKMKIAILLTALFLLSNIERTQAQNQNQNQKDTISLKNLELKQKTWVIDNGFPLTSYSLDNKEVNYQLKNSLVTRKEARIWTTVGLVGLGESRQKVRNASYLHLESKNK